MHKIDSTVKGAPEDVSVAFGEADPLRDAGKVTDEAVADSLYHSRQFSVRPAPVTGSYRQGAYPAELE